MTNLATRRSSKAAGGLALLAVISGCAPIVDGAREQRGAELEEPWLRLSEVLKAFRRDLQPYLDA